MTNTNHDSIAQDATRIKSFLQEFMREDCHETSFLIIASLLLYPQKECEVGISKIKLLRDELLSSYSSLKPSLSPKEQEILHWVLKGKSNSVISDIMEISVHTVDTHLRRISKKLETPGRKASALVAILLGLLNV